jgi:hypothetical protein
MQMLTKLSVPSQIALAPKISIFHAQCDSPRFLPRLAARMVILPVTVQGLRALLTHDFDTAQKLHADDFELINPSGRGRLTRAIHRLGRGVRVLGVETHNPDQSPRSRGRCGDSL